MRNLNFLDVLLYPLIQEVGGPCEDAVRVGCFELVQGGGHGVDDGEVQVLRASVSVAGDARDATRVGNGDVGVGLLQVVTNILVFLSTEMPFCDVVYSGGLFDFQ